MLRFPAAKSAGNRRFEGIDELEPEIGKVVGVSGGQSHVICYSNSRNQGIDRLHASADPLSLCGESAEFVRRNQVEAQNAARIDFGLQSIHPGAQTIFTSRNIQAFNAIPQFREHGHTKID